MIKLNHPKIIMKEETNANFIHQILKLVCKKLDDNQIDYYIVGAIGAYINAHLPLQRIHEDLDLLIEEKDVTKLKDVFKETDFKFHDNRLTSTKTLNQHGYTDGEHEVYAQYKHSNFHIGFFLFRRENTSYTMVEYFSENTAPKRLDRTLPIKFFTAQYDENYIDYLGIKLKTVRKETIYKNKLVMNREKDLFDINKLKPMIDSDKLNNLKGLSKYRKTTIVSL